MATEDDGKEMTTIAITEAQNSTQLQDLIDTFNRNIFTDFTRELENVVLHAPIEVFEEFLAHFSSLNVELKIGNANLLHILVKLLHQIDYTRTSECVKRALYHGVDVNEPDDKNCTPFFYLLRSQPKLPNNDLINLILDEFEVDLHNFKGDKMQELFIKQNPGKDVPRKLEISFTFSYLMGQLQKSNHSQFIANFQGFKSANLHDAPQNGGNLINLSENHSNKSQDRRISEMSEKFQDKCAHFLYAAIIKGAADVTELLVANGINVNRIPKSFNGKKSPIFLAASYGHSRVFETLLKGKANLQSSGRGNILHEILHASYQNSPKTEKVDHQKCFELVLPKCDVNQPDELRSTPLHYAVRHRNDHATLELLKKGANLTARNIFNETPLDDLRKEVFEEFLDDRISLIQIPEDKEQKEVNIKIDLKFLLKSTSEVEALALISKNRELRPLIQHPAIASFISLKWKRYSCIIYSNFLIFLVLLALLVTSIVLSHMGIEYGRDFLKFFSLIAIFSLTIRELFQLIVSTLSGVNYFWSFVNIFEIIFIVFAVLSQTLTDSSDLQIVRAFTIIFAAFELLHLLGELPFLSISTNMVILVKVVMNYIKSMVLYVTLPIAFALAFLVLHGEVIKPTTEAPSAESDPTAAPPDVDQFSNFGFPVIAMLKVMVMGVGEFDAQSLELHHKSSFYWILFILFVFLIPIVLVNVLAGLAFDDIKEVRAEGELTDLRARIKVLAKYEKIICGKIFFLKRLSEFMSIKRVLDDGCIVVSPSRKFAIVNGKQGDSDGCFGDFGDKNGILVCNRLDQKIGKKLRVVIEERKQRKIKDECENEVRNELQAVREEVKSLKIELKALCELIKDGK